MSDYPEFTLAAVQAAPVYFDREASTEKACRLIMEAGQNGADLVAFSETWLPGYPFFHTTSLWEQGGVTYLANAVEIPSPLQQFNCAVQPGVHLTPGILRRFLSIFPRLSLLLIGRRKADRLSAGYADSYVFNLEIRIL